MEEVEKEEVVIASHFPDEKAITVNNGGGGGGGISAFELEEAANAAATAESGR